MPEKYFTEGKMSDNLNFDIEGIVAPNETIKIPKYLLYNFFEKYQFTFCDGVVTAAELLKDYQLFSNVLGQLMVTAGLKSTEHASFLKKQMQSQYPNDIQKFRVESMDQITPSSADKDLWNPPGLSHFAPGEAPDDLIKVLAQQPGLAILPDALYLLKSVDVQDMKKVLNHAIQFARHSKRLIMEKNDIQLGIKYKDA